MKLLEKSLSLYWAFSVSEFQFHFHFIIFTRSNKCRFCDNSEIDTLISKRSSVENKAKLSQLTSADFATIAKLTH